MSCEQLAENFKSYFRVIYADNEQLLKQVYKIRYDVFCEELRLEENCPKDVEKDEYDAYSWHFLLQHKRSGEYAGTVRFIVPPAYGPDSMLPMERHCLSAINTEIIDLNTLEQGTYGEVSRLCVPSRFRKRAGERGKPYSLDEQKTAHSENEKRLFPYISVGLYLTCAALFVRNRLDYAFVMVEPRLARNMARVGIRFEQAGDIIDYHGQRAPFYITQAMLAQHLKPEVGALFEHIKDELDKQLPPLANAATKIAV